MKNDREKSALSSWDEGEIYECAACGNHVCKRCAVMWNGICPNCFSRLYRIS